MNVKLPHLYAQTLLSELQVWWDWFWGLGRRSREEGARKKIRKGEMQSSSDAITTLAPMQNFDSRAC